jgi:hypothetical protein
LHNLNCERLRSTKDACSAVEIREKPKALASPVFAGWCNVDNYLILDGHSNAEMERGSYRHCHGIVP